MLRNRVWMLAAAAGLVGGCVGGASAQLDNGFTYQGRLLDGGAPADGDYEVRLELFDAESGGMPFLTIPFQPVTAEDGLFDVGFNYNDELFDRPGRVFVQIAVRRAGEGGFTVLAPRQQIDAAPLADKANIADIAVEALEAPATTLTEAYIADGGTLTTNAAVGQLNVTGFEGTRFSHGSDGRVEFDFSTGLFGIANNGITQWSITNIPNRFSASLPTDPNGFITEYGENGFNDGGQVFLYSITNTDRAVFGGDGFFAYGNRTGAGDGGLRINGPEVDMLFSSSVAGDGSVVLSPDAISPTETLGEAGIDAVRSSSVTTIEFDQDRQTITTFEESFTAPVDGYCVVIATCQIDLRTSGSLGLDVDAGISDSATLFEAESDIRVGSTRSITGNVGFYPVTTHSVFEIDAGETKTFRFLVQPRFSNVNDRVQVFDKNMTVMFFPTLYGEIPAGVVAGDDSVAPTSPFPAADDTPEISRQNEVDRLRREVEAMRRELEAMRQAERR